jgi:streptogramin lyase
MRIKEYDPAVAMDETLKEINSRTGKFNPETDKWEKFKTPEAMAKWYSADYNQAKINQNK